MNNMRQIAIFALIAILSLSSSATALRAFSGTNVYIDTPVDDDVFASGSVVNINAPVTSATVVGGTVNVNSPIAGDLLVAGGQVTVNAPIGGKIMAAGGNLNIGGNISKNALLMGGQVDIRPGAVIGKDALISGGTVTNAGKVAGNLTVSASTFQSTGSAGRVEFHQIKTEKEQPEYPINPFSIIMTLGYLIAGLLFLRFFPALFSLVDQEVRKSTVVKAVAGFVMLIASMVLILLVFITVIGIPTATIMALLMVVAVMLSGIFVSFSLGRVVFDMLNFKTGDLVVFLIGFLILNGLFYIPFAGGFIKLIAVSLGFGAILYAIRTNWPALHGPA
jgi:hypothetical protein